MRRSVKMPGILLRQERERKQIAVGAVAQETKIGTFLLQAMEANRFEDLPGGIYRTSMLKAYAAFLGLDVDVVLGLYRDNHVAPVEVIPELPRQERRLGRLIFLGALLGIVLPAASFLLFRSMNVLFTAPPALASDTAAASPTLSPVVKVDSQPTESREVRLSIVVEQDCWVRISADGATLENRLLEKGEELQLRARQGFQCVFGSAGALRLSVNGEPQPSMGRLGQVRQVAIERSPTGVLLRDFQ